MQSSTEIKSLFVLGNSSSLVEDKRVRLPPEKKCGLYSAAGKPSRESIHQLATWTQLWNLVSFEIKIRCSFVGCLFP